MFAGCFSLLNLLGAQCHHCVTVLGRSVETQQQGGAAFGASGGEGEEGSWEIVRGPWPRCCGRGMWNEARGIGFPSETFHNTSPRPGWAQAATL